MDRLKVPELKAEAKRLGLRRFSRLRKAELVDAINQALERERERARNLSPIFDEPVPEINSQIIQPTWAVKKNQDQIQRRKVEEKNRQEIRELEEMLGLRKPTSPSLPKIKISTLEEIEKDKKISKLKEINRIRAKITETATALSGFARQFRIESEGNFDESEFMQFVKPDVLRLMRENRQTRIRLILNCYMTRTDLTNGNIITAYPYFHSQTIENHEGTNESEIIDSMIETIKERFQNFTNRGSNWVLERVLSLDVQMTQYIPLRGRSYIPLPKILANKKAIINMKNDDNECFKWCVTRALFPADKHPERIDKNLRENSKRLNWNGLKFPIDVKQITHFEKSNQNISINVFGFQEVVYPLKIFKAPERQHQINLLLIADCEKKHYCLIKDMSKLLSSQITKHNGSIHICLRCLNAFQTNEKLEIHKEICQSNEFIEMPEEGTFIQFENHIRSQKMPFVIYADFESLVESISGCEPNPKNCFTNQFQKHKPCGFCYHIKCSFNENLSKTVTYRMKSENADISQIFVEMIEDDITRIQNIPPKPLIMTQNDWKDFNESTKCGICQEEFEEDEKKVRDHCHFTGKFRGAAHNSCNLKYRKPWFTPVIFHNLQNYDAHLFVKNLGKTEGDIRCIPNNEEKYISFTKKIIVGSWIDKEGKEHLIRHDIRFIDSFKFMASSLDALVKNLERDKKIETKKSLLREKLKERGKTLEEEKLSEEEKKELGEKLDLLSKKGVYPYDFMDNINKFQETNLPPKEKFYSKLNDEHITQQDFEHAQKVWKTFKCKNMGVYHDLYLKTDVLLLADVFEEFRNVCLENYELDPAWYFTSPGLAWDASLKKTEVKLELLTDIDMLQMIEKGTRGGVSMISNRFGKANNKYMKDFNPEKPSTFIPYLDANNLYGWAMCEPLPVGGFEWVDEKEFNDWRNFPCILEVDLDYPKELHDLHNDLPLAPERIIVNNVEKLIPTLNKKEKYVIHHRNLKQYLQMGLKLKKIHRIIKFKEEAWLKPYIELNTKLRANGKNDFEKDFFKLMNNSVFGKTMENIRKRVDIKLVNNRFSALRFAAKPNFESCTIFDENLIAIHMKRVKLLFDKPIYCGMSILDISKTLIFDFHYDYIKPKYQEKAKLLFTDTDSLCYEMETDDFFQDISADVKEKFDTSNFPKIHPSNIPTGINKKVIGMMKDEAGGKIIEEFVGLRSKLYSVRMYEDKKEEKKCKGIKKSVIKKTITHQDYKDCLISGKKQMRSMNIIRSYKHEIFTETVNKIALSANDDKRVIREDGIHTFAKGHYKITK